MSFISCCLSSILFKFVLLFSVSLNFELYLSQTIKDKNIVKFMIFKMIVLLNLSLMSDKIFITINASNRVQTGFSNKFVKPANTGIFSKVFSQTSDFVFSMSTKIIIAFNASNIVQIRFPNKFVKPANTGIISIKISIFDFYVCQNSHYNQR